MVGGNLYNLEMWHMIKELKENGMSISKIYRELGISRPTVRKYLKSEKDFNQFSIIEKFLFCA